jgi:hypothetical protein
LPFSEVAKLLFDKSGKFNRHRQIVNYHRHRFNLTLRTGSRSERGAAWGRFFI